MIDILILIGIAISLLILSLLFGLLMSFLTNDGSDEYEDVIFGAYVFTLMVSIGLV